MQGLDHRYRLFSLIHTTYSSRIHNNEPFVRPCHLTLRLSKGGSRQAVRSCWGCGSPVGLTSSRLQMFSSMFHPYFEKPHRTVLSIPSISWAIGQLNPMRPGMPSNGDGNLFVSVYRDNGIRLDPTA